jgi:SNF2 family DNA or RNA helicase
VIYLEFNHVERILYEVVKKRFVQRINTMTRREGVQSQYSHIWSMLLRLRQICAHPLLIQDTILDLLEREDFERLNELTQETNVDSEETSSMLTHLKHMLTEHLRATFQDARPGHGQGQLEQLTVVPGGQFESEGREEDLGGKHGRNYQFQKYIKSLAGTKEWESINARKKCSSCRSDPYEAIITSCYHVYCRPCVEELQHNAARHNVDHAKCMQCGDEFQSIRVLEDPEVGGAEAVEREATPTGKNKTKGKKKSALDWIGMNGEILPSAKTIAAKAQILEWLSQSDDKIIVYTQFMPMIRIMGKVCDTEDWTYCKYTGEMSHTARENALRDFSDPEGDRQILLASLKSGGLGLNITAASRVIIMDPWWNDAIEQQAFCRVFRIGQEKETQLTRFCIKNTIDAAMFAVKERKMEEIERVMDQTKDNKFLNVAELMKLFGEVGEDEKGRPFIFPEHDDDAEDGIPPYIEPSDKSGGMFAQQDSDMGDEA